MRAIPFPDDLMVGAPRIVIGEPGDPTRTDVRPAEYALGLSTLYPGRPTFTVALALDDRERELIASGAWVLLTLDGAEVPWSVGVLGDDR